ncbi:hypothetical protein D9M72_453210 [compost metagenome]
MCGQPRLVEGLIQQPMHGLFGCGGHEVEAAANKALDDLVIERAALGRTGIAVERQQRMQAKNAPGVDRVGVAPQPRYLAKRIFARLQVRRRLGRRAFGKRLPPSVVEHPGPVQIVGAIGLQGRSQPFAAKREQPLQPARGNGGCCSLAHRAGEDQPPCAAGHLEVMRELADAPLGGLETDARLHRARQERVVGGLAWPIALVHGAEHHEIHALQA